MDLIVFENLTQIIIPQPANNISEFIKKVSISIDIKERIVFFHILWNFLKYLLI